MEILQNNQIFYLCTVFAFGLMIGSFLNVVISRLPVMMRSDWREQCCELLELDSKASEQQTFNLISPRSRCPDCRHQITALENIPIISYLFLKGRCKACKNSISIRYPLIELASAISAIIVAFLFGSAFITAFMAILLTWALITLSMIDCDHQLLPDDITLPFLWLGIGLSFFNIFTDLHTSVLGAILGYGSLWSVYILFKLVTGKEGMGHGDFKLLAMLGAWLGYQALPLIIVMSSLLGTVMGLSMIIWTDHDKHKPIPFGPYLAMAGWISMLWGEDIMSMYFTLI